jgi:hypothetical protein
VCIKRVAIVNSFLRLATRNSLALVLEPLLVECTWVVVLDRCLVKETVRGSFRSMLISSTLGMNLYTSF